MVIKWYVVHQDIPMIFLRKVMSINGMSASEKSLDPGLRGRAPFSTYLRQVIYIVSLPTPWKLIFPAALEPCERMDLGTY